MISISDTLSAGPALETQFQKLSQNIERSPKGVRSSEMLFVCATAQPLKPKRFLESGTAGGQSTIQLARSFPNAKVITYELNEEDSLVHVAEKRLKDVPNVERQFGNSMGAFPSLLEKGDVVVIDGPKGFKALRFAFQLLATGKPALIFIHDFHVDLPERRFVERYLPHAFFSDDPAFVWQYAYLDSRSAQPPERGLHGERPLPGSVPKGYGATFVCIPPHPKFNTTVYKRLMIQRTLWRAYYKLRSRLGIPTPTSGG